MPRPLPVDPGSPTDAGRAATRMGRGHAGRAGAVLMLTLIALASGASASVQFPSTPDWQSGQAGQYGTGCALRDLDGDGWPDIVVANGNDMERQALAVYLNQGNGLFPANPTWSSSDLDYNGHLDLADVDGDGVLDCAVAVYIGAGGFGTPGRVKLYRGLGNGTFSSAPVWTSGDTFYCFSVAFGDANGDGRPDLACAAGEPYNRYKASYRVYRNAGAALESLPYWRSGAPKLGLDVTWGDINRDGFLDLAFAGAAKATGSDPIAYPNEVYFGDGNSFPADPDWVSTDPRYLANTLSLGDLNGDGWLDLAVADNNQTGGAGDGRTKLYLNDGAGALASTPGWTSTFDGYGSHVSFADVDDDGDLDLAAGAWWGKVRIYENAGGTIPGAPSWQSSTTSVIETISWDDADRSGVGSPYVEFFTGDGQAKVFAVRRRPFTLLDVRIDGASVPPGLRTSAPEGGWIALGTAPPAGATVELRYAAAAAPDFAVSNWDPGVGDYLFLNRLVPVAAPASPAAPVALTAAPNPARRGSPMRFSGVSGGGVLEVFDASGAALGSWRVASGPAVWDGRDQSGRPVSAGSYWVRLTALDGPPRTTRVVIYR